MKQAVAVGPSHYRGPLPFSGANADLQLPASFMLPLYYITTPRYLRVR